MPAPTNHRGSVLPLDGVRVIDTTSACGEMCGRLLADLGADVVRVEAPGGGASRRFPPFAPDGTSLNFAFRNANKRSVVIDPERDADRRRFDDLLAGADVWIESSDPEFAAAGFDPAAVSARLPHLVVLSMTNFGLTGPYRHHTATDPVMLAMSGLLFRSGTVDRPPLLPPGSFADDAASVTGCVAVLTALWAGGGAHIDLSVMEAAAQTSDWSLPIASWLQGIGATSAEVRDGSGVYTFYRCADGQVRALTMSLGQWRAMCEWMDAPDWLREPHWENPAHRAGIADVVSEMISAHLIALTRQAACDEGQRRGIAITPVLTPVEALAAKHFIQRRTFLPGAEVAPGVTATTFSGFMTRDGARLGFRHRAPELDEHGDVLQIEPVGRTMRTPVSPSPASRRPFAGIRVLDFGVAGVAPEAARLFADYGAEVVKVENRNHPDVVRVLTGTDMTATFASSSRGKRSLGLDLTTSQGLELAKDLIRTADVLVENTGPGVMERLGLSWEVCRQLNPGLVYVSSQMMGSGGEWSEWTGFGPNTHAPSGLSYLWNWQDRVGEIPPGSRTIFPDHVAGRLCAMAAIAGLIARRGTGEGSRFEVAQVDTVIGLIGDLLMAESLAEGSAGPLGNSSGRGAPWGVYPCEGDEQWCVITVTDDEAWSRLCAAMGTPSWSEEPALATTDGRRQRSDELDAHLAEWTKGFDARALTAVLQQAGVAAGFLMYPSAMPDDPHLVARGFPQRIEQPSLGPVVLEGAAFHAAAFDEPIATPAPALGGHTRDVCRELLGLSDDRIDQLIADGILQIPRTPDRTPS